MSDLRPATAEPAIPLTPDTLRQLGERPLLALPPELRPDVFRTWTLFRHLAGMDSPAALAFPVAAWIGRHGYTPGRVRRALAEVTDPRHMKAIRFPSDLVSKLAELLVAGERTIDASELDPDLYGPPPATRPETNR